MLFLSTTMIKADDFYWIGGDGNWSDTTHWYSDSGVGIPSESDNAIFNSTSFTAPNQMLTIDVVATCRDLNWSGINNPAIISGSKTLNIYGSMKLSAKLDNNFSGDIYFLSNSVNNVIQTTSVHIHSDVYFSGNGSWELQDTLTVENNQVNLESGSLILAGEVLCCGSFLSTSAADKTINLNNSILRIHSLDGKWEVNSSLNIFDTGGKILFINDDFHSVNIFRGGNQTYNHVKFENNGHIYGNNTFRNLYFSPQNTYSLESNKSQTIIEKLHARGCQGLITIQSDGSDHAILTKSSGNVVISFVSLASIKAEMGQGNLLLALHSVDLSNNEGCDIKEEGRDMHWINGTGLWSDTVHWSSPMGGNDQDCIPLLYDNVFFDQNSFSGIDTVQVDIENISCNDMSWEGTDQAVFVNTLPDPVLNIYGSLEFVPGIDNVFQGNVYFRDTLSGQTVRTSNVGFNKDVFFEGINGGYTYAILMLAILGILGFVFALMLKREDSRSGYGLELPTNKKKA